MRKYYLLAIVIFLFSCNTINLTPPVAQKGVLDLTNWQFEKDGIVNLHGEYEFYWEEFKTDFSTPKEHEILNVPQDWNNHPYAALSSGIGYATYRLRILTPANLTSLSLHTEDIATAFQLFVNSEPSVSAGKPTTAEFSTEPQYQRHTFQVKPIDNQIELVFHVSNFHHRRGGIWETMKIGTHDQLKQYNEWQLIADFFLLGSIIIIGIYHIGLFTLRKQAKTLLYLGIFCFLIGLRLLSAGNMFILTVFPDISWVWHMRFEYASLFIAVPVYALFVKALLSNSVHNAYVKFAFWFSGICAVIVLFNSPYIFSFTSPVYQVFILFSIGYGIYAFAREIRNANADIWYMLIGFIVLGITSINDILNVNNILWNGELIGMGLFVFIVFQALQLGSRFATALSITEKSRAELESSNKMYLKELHKRRKTQQEKQVLEDKLTRSQKMEALGILAGTIAHDLNNILTAITIYPDIIKARIKKNKNVENQLDKIRETGMQAAVIIKDMLALARRGKTVLAPLDLNETIMDYLGSPEHDMLKNRAPHLTFKTILDPKLENINGSEVHIKKLLMNLTYNAAEAQIQQGDITITTSALIADNFAAKHLSIPTGEYSVLRIRDNGVGISPEHLDKIFEPFYTTKKMGQSGSGLGMSVVWSTIKDHNSYIKVESAINSGTTFSIFFPATKEAENQKKEPIENPAEFYKSNGEQILVIENNVQQSIMVTEMLQEMNYKTNTVVNFQEANAYLENNRVDCIILDIYLEDMNETLDAVKKLKNAHKKMGLIVTTGHMDNFQNEQIQEMGIHETIFKPYTVDELGSALKREIQRVQPRVYVVEQKKEEKLRH